MQRFLPVTYNSQRENMNINYYDNLYFNLERLLIIWIHFSEFKSMVAVIEEYSN